MSDKETKLPKLIENRIDLKSLTLSVFYDFIESAKQQDALLNHKLVFYTTLGIVDGTLLVNDKDTDENNPYIEVFHEKIIELRHERLKEYEKDNDDLQLVNDTNSIPLVDVTITPYNGGVKHKLSYFLLFTDQIVGISYGEYQDQPE